MSNDLNYLPVSLSFLSVHYICTGETCMTGSILTIGCPQHYAIFQHLTGTNRNFKVTISYPTRPPIVKSQNQGYAHNLIQIRLKMRNFKKKIRPKSFYKSKRSCSLNSLVSKISKTIHKLTAYFACPCF